MPLVATRALISIIEKTGRELNVNPPAAFTSAVTTARALVEQTERLESYAGPLNSRVLEVLLNGDDDITDDPAIRRLALLRVIGDAGIRAAGADKSTQLLEQAITASADQICDKWIAAVKGDCSTLTSAAAELHDIADLRAVAPADIKAVGKLDIWSSALSAFDRLDTFTVGFGVVIAAMEVRHTREHRPCIFSDDVDVVVAINSATHGTTPVDAWAVATIGAPLVLANASTYVDRVAQYDAEMDRRRAEEQALRQPDGFDTQRRREAAVP